MSNDLIRTYSLKVFTNPTPNIVAKSAIALGFFDGVHKGHQSVIASAVNYAKANNITSGVVTFKDHPRALTTFKQPLLLTTLDQRLKQFEHLGVEIVLVLTFTPELCNLSAKDYVKNILKGSMGARYISVGQNHHFGKDRQGDCVLLQSMAKENLFALHICPILTVDNFAVSSTVIRENLALGNVEIVNKLIGRGFCLTGTVISGHQRGRTIGYPTANIQVTEFQSIPANGVYAGLAKINNQEYKAVINIGIRPTFNNTHIANPLIEAHILDFNQDIYNQEIEISFLNYVRPEQKFNSVEALIAQITKDCNFVKAH